MAEGRRPAHAKLDLKTAPDATKEGTDPMPEPILPPQPGQKAPDFRLMDQNNHLFSLSDVIGKWVVIYFYPKALTSGCTRQACDVTAAADTWQRLNAEVIGISADPVPLLATFAAQEHLHHRLLADPEHQVCDLYGAWQKKSMYGRSYWGVQRMTYIVDPEGRVAHVMPKVNSATHSQDVARWLEQHA